jgi:hypothetical protein
MKLLKKNSVREKIDEIVAAGPPEPPVYDEIYRERPELWAIEIDRYDRQLERYEAEVRAMESLGAAQKSINSDKISKDTIFAGFTSLAGILAILVYEQKDIIRSKALGFVTKIKL